MSTGIILGLGLITIAFCFYIMLNIPYWLMLLNKRKNDDFGLEKKYHLWVYTSDDFLNKILKFCIYCLYGYGVYVFILEIFSKFFWINYLPSAADLNYTYLDIPKYPIPLVRDKIEHPFNIYKYLFKFYFF